MREITLSPKRKEDGTLIENDPIRAYDTVGQWGAPDFHNSAASGSENVAMSRNTKDAT